MSGQLAHLASVAPQAAPVAATPFEQVHFLARQAVPDNSNPALQLSHFSIAEVPQAGPDTAAIPFWHVHTLKRVCEYEHPRLAIYPESC